MYFVCGPSDYHNQEFENKFVCSANGLQNRTKVARLLELIDRLIGNRSCRHAHAGLIRSERNGIISPKQCLSTSTKRTIAVIEVLKCLAR